jgi:hypothetical protein
MADLKIALYVSSVEGRHVQRYGSETMIGAVIDRSVEGLVRWDTEKVVAIPEAEYQAYRAEYERLIREGSLVRRTAADFDAHNELREERIETNAALAEVKAKHASMRPPVSAATFEVEEK